MLSALAAATRCCLMLLGYFSPCRFARFDSYYDMFLRAVPIFAARRASAISFDSALMLPPARHVFRYADDAAVTLLYAMLRYYMADAVLPFMFYAYAYRRLRYAIDAIRCLFSLRCFTLSRQDATRCLFYAQLACCHAAAAMIIAAASAYAATLPRVS